jgi:Protein of unknown function (DUF3295)
MFATHHADTREWSGINVAESSFALSSSNLSAMHTNGPFGVSPRKNDLQGFAQPSSVTGSTTHAPVLEACDTRRNMLSHELIESLQRHIWWERQSKGLTINAHAHRQEIQPTLAPTNGNSYDNSFDDLDYHQKGC